MSDRQADSVRRELHGILDRIPDASVSTAHKFLRSLLDPVTLSLLTATDDDEPETDEERAAVEAARRETGIGTPHEKLLEEFGI